ncbi:MAG TPA: GAF domain-containing protein [Longimicrobiaceae bacterium]|nr:GAF domain-containing protein [Longimicrobiaceae bacterium]
MIASIKRGAEFAWGHGATAAVAVTGFARWLHVNVPRGFTPGQQKIVSGLLAFLALAFPIVLHETQISMTLALSWLVILLAKEGYALALNGNRDSRWRDAERVRAGALAGAIHEIGELLRVDHGRQSRPISKPVVISNLLRALEDDIRRLTGKQGSVNMMTSMMAPVAASSETAPDALYTVAISQNLGPNQFKQIEVDSNHPPAVAYRYRRPVIVSDAKMHDCQELQAHPSYRSLVAFPITFKGISEEVLAVVVVISEETHTFTAKTVDRRFEEVISPYLQLFAVLQTIA